MTERRAVVDSPMGRIEIRERHDAIVALTWPCGASDAPTTDLLRAAAAQLDAYFAGEGRTFDLPLRPEGGALAQRVFEQMRGIPFGETRTYGDIGEALGAPAQPIGQACGSNPIPILIPCHRVIGANGLGGFSAKGGVEDKVWLLRHEGAASLLL